MIEVMDLTVVAPGVRGCLFDRLSFTLYPGERVALMGPSGSGKSTLLRALIGLLPPGLKRVSGSIMCRGRSILAGPQRLPIRGREVGMIFQDPATFLNPRMRVGRQIMESYELAHPQTEGTERMEELLERLGFNLPDLHRYPYELSGGMRQKVLIALALVAKPPVVLADEPLASLDATSKAQCLEVLRQECASLIIATHHEDDVRSLCHRTMFLGDRGSCNTQVSQMPPSSSCVVMSGRNLSKRYGSNIEALAPVSFELCEGAVLGVVGPNGSGKTTLARIVTRFTTPSSGTLWYRGENGSPMRTWRRKVQLLFQHPATALPPHMKVLDIVREPFEIQGIACNARQWLEYVGLEAQILSAYPATLSLGEQHKVALARALALEPDIVVCDEITAALDPTSRAHMIRLLQKVQKESKTSLIWISHDRRTLDQMTHYILTLPPKR